MSVIQGLLETQQMLSQMQDRESLRQSREIQNQATLMQIAMQRRAMDEQDFVRKKLAELNVGQQDQGPPAEQVSKVNMPTVGGMLSSEMAGINKQMEDLSKRQKVLLQAPSMRSESDKIQNQITALQGKKDDILGKLLKQQKEDRSEAGSSAYSMWHALRDGDVQTAQAIWGGLPDEQRRMIGIPTGLDGNPVLTGDTVNVLHGKAMALNGAALQAREDEDNWKARNAEENRKQREATQKMTDAIRQQNASLRREGMEERKSREGRLEQQDEENYRKEANKDIEKIESEVKFPQFKVDQRNFELYSNKLLRGQKLTAAEVQNVQSLFTSAINEYRSRAGATKIEQQRVKSLNSNLGAVEKWFGSLGYGTPPLTKEAVGEITGAFNQLYSVRNAEVMEKAIVVADDLDKQVNRLAKKSNQAPMVSREDVRTLANFSDYLKTIPKDHWGTTKSGKTWVKIGDGEGDDNIYEVPKRFMR